MIRDNYRTLSKLELAERLGLRYKRGHYRFNPIHWRAENTARALLIIMWLIVTIAIWLLVYSLFV